VRCTSTSAAAVARGHYTVGLSLQMQHQCEVDASVHAHLSAQLLILRLCCGRVRQGPRRDPNSRVTAGAYNLCGGGCAADRLLSSGTGNCQNHSATCTPATIHPHRRTLCSLTDRLLLFDQDSASCSHFECRVVQAWWVIQHVLVPYFFIPVLGIQPYPAEYVQH
jgi:hypothetical protein